MIGLLRLKQVLLGQYNVGAINNSLFYDRTRSLDASSNFSHPAIAKSSKYTTKGNTGSLVRTRTYRNRGNR